MIRGDPKPVVAVCAGVTLLTAVLAVWWSTTDRYQLTGDEPHYFILAASLLRDGDVDVRNNFDEDAATGEIYGPIRGPTRTDLWRPRVLESCARPERTSGPPVCNRRDRCRPAAALFPDHADPRMGLYGAGLKDARLHETWRSSSQAYCSAR